jgi:endonuclease/exonuclease/phosphatase (EEP) superfamily protein YafD
MRLLETTRGHIRSLFQGLFRVLRRLLRLTVIVGNLLGLIGFFVRDRSLLLAFFLYLPLLPLGVCAVCLGFHDWRGPSRWLSGFLLVVGLVSMTCGAYWMFGRGTGSAPASQREGRELSILQWNVLWGRYWNTSLSPWNSIVAEIVDRDPDILVMSEAPPLARMYASLERLPGRRFVVFFASSSKNTHVYDIYVSARWPVRLERRVSIANGAAAIVVVDHPARPVRLMVVDGRSKITQLRTPMLRDIALTCTRAAEAGDPIDLIAGDFNAISRSIGFDEFLHAGGGYQLASRSCLDWRGTWPAVFPLFDIDHVWVRSGWTIPGCRLFTNLATDHRGQFVRLGLDRGS